MLSFFPRDVLDEILDLIESISGGGGGGGGGGRFLPILEAFNPATIGIIKIILDFHRFLFCLLSSF